MAIAMTVLLRQWQSDPNVDAVLLDGAGGARILRRRGHPRALRRRHQMGDSLPARFWATEYKLNVLIARYPKPIVAVMDGLVMGGGVGLSAHAAHRVVTDRSAIAMPEVGIGFFPDVGACFLLARAPGYIGTYLALTGDRIGAADAVHCGLADVHVPADRLGELPVASPVAASADGPRRASNGFPLHPLPLGCQTNANGSTPAMAPTNLKHRRTVERDATPKLRERRSTPCAKPHRHRSK